MCQNIITYDIQNSSKFKFQFNRLQRCSRDKMSKILQVYGSFLKKFPTIAPMIQTGFLMGTGDVISQAFIETKDFNYTRTLRFAGLGTFVVGPAVAVWYRVLAKYVGEKGGTKEVVTKVVLDQFVFCPSFLPVFLTSLGLVEGKNFDQIKRDIKEPYFDILIANYKVWPFVQVINFYLIPTRHQVAFVQSIAVFWNTYVSWKTHKKFVES